MEGTVKERTKTFEYISLFSTVQSHFLVQVFCFCSPSLSTEGEREEETTLQSSFMCVCVHLHICVSMCVCVLGEGGALCVCVSVCVCEKEEFACTDVWADVYVFFFVDSVCLFLKKWRMLQYFVILSTKRQEHM